MDPKRKVPVIDQTELFSTLKYGQLFTVDDSGAIWCKTPMANMYVFNNRYSTDGAFCTAVCINVQDGYEQYMQCDPMAVCTLVDIEQLFGTVERY